MTEEDTFKRLARKDGYDLFKECVARCRIGESFVYSNNNVELIIKSGWTVKDFTHYFSHELSIEQFDAAISQ